MNKGPNNKVDLSIREEFLSLSALNQWVEHDSSPRGCMFLTQLSQAVVLDNPEPRIVQSGLEKQLVDNTFKIVVEEDMIVKSIITSNGNTGDIENVPLITIIGENVKSGEMDCYDIPYYFSLHQYFGFKYKRSELLGNIYVGMLLEEGTVLAESPGVVDNNYCYGVNANIALITDPATGQDGIIISEELAKKMQYRIYVRGSMEWGADSFPLNLYGDEDNYKAFPEVGECIGIDQVFGVIREYDKDIGPALTSKRDTMDFNPIFDKAIYVKPTKYLNNENDRIVNNRVVDLKIYHSPNSKKEPLYNGEQTHKIIRENKGYLHSLVKAFEGATKDAYKNKTASPRLQRKLVEAYTLLPDDEKIVYKFRNDKVDLYRVEFCIEFVCQVNFLNKLTDGHGAKGVIVDVRPKEQMVKDQYGNYADIIMDPTSIPSRMNSGRLYESYFGAASRNAKRLILEHLGSAVDEASDDLIKSAFTMVLDFLQIIGTEQYVTYSKITKVSDMCEILQEIQDKEFYIYYKVSSKKKSPLIVKDMENSKFKVPKAPVFVDGKPTKAGITIGNLYIVLLNKVADGYLASASPSINHFGIPVRVNTSTKVGLPFTNNPTKIISETESRLYRSYAKSPLLAAELKDRASSIETHAEIYRNILRSKTPSNIAVAVDRTIVPYGTDNSLKLLKDIFNSTGIDFGYVKGID